MQEELGIELGKEELKIEDIKKIQERMGYSFLSELPIPLHTLEEIINRSRPTSTKKEELKRRLMESRRASLAA